MMVTGEDRQAPHLPGMEASFDYIGIAFHGLVCTHLDALCHIFREGVMYNGRPASEVRSRGAMRSEEHTSELQSLMRISYAVFCLKKKNITNHKTNSYNNIKLL